ncbi:MAG: hypothetical protein MJ147_02075 [Clostridia bacterium]|nr:hypothetical protein [Clostridia bacterium]
MLTKKINFKSFKHIIIAALSVMMAIAIVFTSYGAIVGEVYAYSATYISEVKVFSGDSLANAIKKCRDAGYTAVEKNLNHSDKGDLKENGIYVIGYKTTDKEEDSITGLSMLQMNSGYQDCTYGDVAERAVEKLGNIPEQIMNAVGEFVENYTSGSAAAIAARKTLDCYYIDEYSNRKLGEYLVSGQCTVDFIKKLFARSSTSVVSAVCNALVAGVAERSDSNWAIRLSKSSEFQKQLQDDTNYAVFDKYYKSLANELVEGLQAFAKSFHDAKDRYDENNKKVEIPETDEKDNTVIPEETVEDMVNGGEIQFEDGDAFYLYAYGMLNQYNYNETTKLGDYIVSLGDSSYKEIKDLRKIYPLVKCLTNGQFATMRLSGVAFSAIYLCNERGLIEKADEQITAIKKDIKSKTGVDAMSIWTGTDQTIYNQKVAVTSDAYRANSAGQIYNTLTSPDSVDSFLSESMSKLEIAMTVIGVAYAVTQIAATTIGYMSAFAIGSLGTSASIWTVCCAGIGSGIFGTIFGALGCAVIILNYVALAAMFIIIVALVIKAIWDAFTDDDAEDFSPIPAVMFDLADNRYVKYEVVCEGDEPANINGANARRWNALYYTKSVYVGKPICSSEIDDLITVQYNDHSTPIGYTPVKCFGEVFAANLNANSKSDSASVYMFLKTTPNEINEGTEQQTTGDGYISKLLLSVESSPTAAKAALTKAGLKVIDINLTPATADSKRYTYLGYDTTKNPNDAVTDIRISAKNTSGSFSFGNASYTSCGTTPTGDTLYYTSYKTAGSPILADIQVKNSLKDAPSGYEPVNMFCGGNAFNFNVGSEIDNTFFASHDSQPYDNWNDKGMYLYFKPSVAYTEGEEYISGIVLVAGMPTSGGGHSADEYIKSLGLKKFDQNLTHGWKAEERIDYEDSTDIIMWKNVDTYICYTTTHNPYRAIYGIKSYTSEPGNVNVSPLLGSIKTGAYSVCDTLFSLPSRCSGKPDKDDLNRGIYASHSYQFPNTSGERTGIIQGSLSASISPEDYEKVDWKSCTERGKGIYVLGPVENGTPLTLNDVVVSSDTEAPNGFVSVQDFKTPNRTEPHNLGYNSSSKYFINKDLEPVYIYQRQQNAGEKKYISSISVKSFDFKAATGAEESKFDDRTKKKIYKTADDCCIQGLLAECTDEIVQSNLAVSYSQSVYAVAEPKNKDASYIGVSRTDTETSAITGIIRYKTDKKDVPTTIKVENVEYIKAGDMIKDPKGSYYLYYTDSAGASPGMPLTSLSVSKDVFDKDCATAMTTTSTDTTGIDGSAAASGKLFGDSSSELYLHMAYADTATMMEAVYVGHGKTKKEAQCNLLDLGCNMCIDLDLNKDTKGEYIYIGYTRYTLFATEYKKGVANPKYAVRDIIVTVGEEHKKSFTIGKAKYTSALDEYTSVNNYDGVNAVSLNTGNGGKKVYVYYTITKTAETEDPIARLGASCRDYAMINTDDFKWEHILDPNGNKANVNEGALKIADDGSHIVDNRIYLYASRCNGSVKESAAVDMNSISSEFATYDVYMKGVK